jgi:insertion element IS1 protein InsB
MGSFVSKKQEQRWLWHAIDHRTGEVLASVFGRRQDAVFLRLKALLEPFRITRFQTDDWGAYGRHLDPEAYHPGKRHTQHIERKHLTWRTRIKRLVRKPIGFSNSIEMHDSIIGLFVNRYEFGTCLEPWDPDLKHYHREFNMFLWMPPSGARAGDILMADSTIFSTLFGGDESLERFWKNLAAA